MKKLFLIAALFCVHESGNASPIYKLINEYVEKNYFNTDYNFRVWNIANQILTGTQFQSKININETPQEGYVNIYVLEKDPQEYFRKCNCEYLEGNVIICDKKVFDYFNSLTKITAETKVLAISGKEEVGYKTIGEDISLFSNLNIGYFLLAYTLGHELGHLILNHKVASYVARPEGNGEIVYNETVFENELRADSFAINRIEQLENYDLSWVYHGLNLLISRTYPNALRLWNERDTSPIYLFSKRTEHPPFIYRLLQMSQIMLRAYKNKIYDNTGYYEFLMRKLVLSDTAKKIFQTDCETSGISHEGIYNLNKLTVDTGDLTFFFQRCRIFLLANNFRLIKGYLNWGEKNIAKNSDQHSIFRANSDYYLGVIEYRSGNYSGAIDLFEQISDPSLLYDNSLLYFYYGMSCMAINENQKGIVILRKQLETNFLVLENWVAMGIANEYAGDEVSSENCYKVASILDSTFSEINFIKYRCEIPDIVYTKISRGGKYKLKSLDLSKEEEVRLNLSLLAGSFYQQGNSVQAQNLMRILVIPDNLKPLTPTEVGEMKNFLAMCIKLGKGFQEAKELYKECLTIREKNLERSGLDMDRFYVAQTLFNIGNLEIEAWNNRGASLAAYEQAKRQLSSVSFENISENLWYESIKIINRIALEQFYNDMADEGLNSIFLLDSLSNKFSFYRSAEVKMRMKVINYVFFYLKRMLKIDPSYRTEAIFFLDKAIRNLKSDNFESNDLKQELIEGCNYLKSYFSDIVKNHEINAIDYFEEGNSRRDTEKKFYYLRAFYELELALSKCKDDRWFSLFNSLLQVKGYINYYWDDSDTLLKTSKIAMKYLELTKGKSNLLYIKYSIDSIANLIYRELTFVYLSMYDLTNAEIYAKKALRVYPDNQEDQLIYFITKPYNNQMSEIKTMSLSRINLTLKLIDSLPDVVRELSMVKIVIQELRNRRMLFG